MQSCLPFCLSGDFAVDKVGACFSAELEAAAQQHRDESAFLQNIIPFYELGASPVKTELGLPPSPRYRDSLFAGNGEERLLGGCTQPLSFMETMLMCHPTVLVADSLKHSNVPTVLIHCELVCLSDVDESSPALTAATFKPLNSALKLATH